MSLETQAPPAPAPAVTADPDVLELVIQNTRPANEREAEQIRTALEDLGGDFADGQLIDGQLTAEIDRKVRAIERLLSDQLNEIVHHPEYQALEQVWRGVEHLVRQSDVGPDLEICVWNVGRQDLLDDLAEAQGDVRRTRLFDVVCRREFGAPGGQPYGLVVGGERFGPGPQDVRLLDHVARVCAEAHTVYLAGAAPEFFGITDPSFAGLVRHPDDLKALFDSDAYADWKAFRAADHSRHVGLVLPGYTPRLPFGPRTRPAPGLPFFEEEVAGPDARNYLWGNPSFLLGQRFADSVTTHGWPVRITGYAGGGRVDGLPLHTFEDEAGQTVSRPPVGVALDDALEKALADLGFIPLAYYRGSTTGVFYAAPSAHEPQLTGDAARDADARIAARLPPILASSRIAHYLKIMLRDLIGSAKTREQIQSYLEDWVRQYTLANPEAATDALKAARPLKAAVIEVAPVEGQPGWFTARVTLMPHLPVEAVSVVMKIDAGTQPAPK